MKSAPRLSTSSLPVYPHIPQFKGPSAPSLCVSSSRQTKESDDTFQTANSLPPYFESPISTTSGDLQNLTGPEPIIAVMGLTGAGKSKFLKLATGSDDIRIGEKMASCTQEIQVIQCQNPLQYCDVLFVDTPGFDDTVRTDMDILQELSDWLEKTYRSGIKLSGILYLHRITDNRMGNSILRNLDFFRKLCGEDALSNIRLVTTHWDLVQDKNEGERAEQQLRDNYWKPFIKSGAQVHRFQHSCASAWEIVNSLPMERKAIQIQKELVDQNKPLSRTTVGQSLFSWAVQALRDFINQLKIWIKEHMSSEGSQHQSNLKDKLREAQEDLRRIESQRSHPRRSRSWRSRTFSSDPVGSSNESTFSRNSNTSQSHGGSLLTRVYGGHGGSLRRRTGRARSPHQAQTGTTAVESVETSTASPQSSVCDIPDIDSLYEVATGADVAATGTLTCTIQTLKVAQASVTGLPVPGLAAAVNAALRVAELLKEMRDTDRSLVILINNVGRFIRTICDAEQPVQDYPQPVIKAIEEFSRQLRKIEQVAQKIKTRSWMRRYALDPDDRRIIIDCNDAIKLGLHTLGIRIGLNNAARNGDIMLKLVQIESLVSRMLSKYEEITQQQKHEEFKKRRRTN